MGPEPEKKETGDYQKTVAPESLPKDNPDPFLNRTFVSTSEEIDPFEKKKAE